MPQPNYAIALVQTLRGLSEWNNLVESRVHYNTAPQDADRSAYAVLRRTGSSDIPLLSDYPIPDSINFSLAIVGTPSQLHTLHNDIIDSNLHGFGGVLPNTDPPVTVQLLEIFDAADDWDAFDYLANEGQDVRTLRVELYP